MTNNQQPAKMWSCRLLGIAALVPIVGCRAKPNEVVTFKSPYNSVFYTVESFNGSGPLTSDFTHVYVHYPDGRKEFRQEVLSGPYLNPKIHWDSANEVEFCINKGRTVEFLNYATLTSDSAPQIEMHHHLNENC